MADDTRKTRSDLSAAEKDVLSMDFFELLRQLETEDLRFGCAGGSGREPARLGQTARLSFAASAVAELVRPAGQGAPFVGVNVLGLLGPEGPMPLHITRWIMQRLSNRWFAGDSSGATSDTSFIDFVNLLQHRMMALYWRGWAEARPDVQIARKEGGRITAMMRALAGIGLPGTQFSEEKLDGAKLHHMTSLAQEAQSPERLITFLETVIGLPIQLDEFVGVWIDIPAHLQTCLGQRHCGLGTAAVIGGRTFDRQSHAELRVGPLTLDQFSTFLNDPERWEQLRHAVIFASGKELKFGLRLVLAAGAVPTAQLGKCQIGLTTWLNPDSQDEADDLCIHRLVEKTTCIGSARRAA